MSTEESNSVEQGGSTPLPKITYSPAEAAKVLGVCQDTVYRLIRRGKLRASNALRHKLIPRSEIERFLESTLQ